METLIVEKMLKQIAEALAVPTCMVAQLQELGYTLPFELAGNRILCPQMHELFDPRDFQVEHIHSAGDLCHIYGLNNTLLGIKGILLVPMSSSKKS